MLRWLCLLALVMVISAAPQEGANISYEGLDAADKPQSTPEESPLEAKDERYSEDEPEPGVENQENEEENINDTDVLKADEKDTNEFENPNAEPSNTYELTTPADKPDIPKKVPTARFLSKLSYFKSSEEEGSSVLNFIERTSKRKFRSRCRCEKITNCPKLQISVPRCPQDYFMCCF